MSCGLQAARTHAHTHTYLLCPHRIDIPSSQVLTLRLTENAKPGRVKGKGKIRPRTGHEGSKGAYRYSSTVFLTSTLDGGGWSTPEKRPGTHRTGGWAGPRTDLDGCGKSRPPQGFDPRTVHPVASRYTD